MSNITYHYRALDKQGGDIVGVLDAVNEKDVYNKLTARGLSPYEVTAKREKTANPFSQFRRVRSKDSSRYLRQLAILLSANVTVLDALTTLSKSRAHPLLAENTRKVISDLRAGKKLSASLEERLPQLPVYVFRLADLGEATGSLAKTLSDAADRMEYEERIRADIKSALTYPLFLMLVGGTIIILMFIFVVPRFATLLGPNIEKAPWISRTVIEFGLWMQTNVFGAFAMVVLSVVAGIMLFRSERVKIGARKMLEKMPLAGSLIMKSEIGGWCRTVGVAIDNKAQLIDALRLGETGTRSQDFRNNLEQVRRRVRAGRPLEEALAEAIPDFDPIVYDLIRTGRNAGALGEMLIFAAGQFEQETKERTKQLTALAEPIAIVGIAMVVAAVVISIVLAMTSLYDFDF